MLLRPGMKLESQTCATTVMVIRAPAGEVDLRCGGVAMAAPGTPVERTEILGDPGPGTLTGKRYSDDEAGIELLCTKPGPGTLTIGDQPIAIKDAKPLPSSD